MDKSSPADAEVERLARKRASEDARMRLTYLGRRVRFKVDVEARKHEFDAGASEATTVSAGEAGVVTHAGAFPSAGHPEGFYLGLRVENDSWKADVEEHEIDLV